MTFYTESTHTLAKIIFLTYFGDITLTVDTRDIWIYIHDDGQLVDRRYPQEDDDD
jgi:hypothetical protein